MKYSQWLNRKQLNEDVNASFPQLPDWMKSTSIRPMIKKAFADTLGSMENIYVDIDKIRSATLSGYERDKQLIRYSYMGECFIKYAIAAAGGIKQFKDDLLKYACINYYDGYASNHEEYDYMIKSRNAAKWEHIYTVNGSRCFFFDPVSSYGKDGYNHLVSLINSIFSRRRLDRIRWCAVDAGALYPYEVMILLSYLATIDLFGSRYTPIETIHKEYIGTILESLIPNDTDTNTTYAGPVYAKGNNTETMYAFNIKFRTLMGLDKWFSEYYISVIVPRTTDLLDTIITDDRSIENLFNEINDEEV